jgi:carnitine 3-dehydrogenase
MTQPTNVQRVAVLGAGTIGASWAAWFLSRGIRVSVWDPRPEAADYVRRTVNDAWPAMARLSMAAGASPDAWTFCARAEDAVAEAEFVQENRRSVWRSSVSYLHGLTWRCPRKQCWHLRPLDCL